MQDLGKHFIVGISSTELKSEEKKLIKDLNPLGFIFFNRNFASDLSGDDSWTEQFSQLIKEIKQASKRKKLIFSIDHEGGRVNRLPAPITSFPYAQNYKNEIKTVAKKMATELCSLGLNLSYAPVLDLSLIHI